MAESCKNDERLVPIGTKPRASRGRSGRKSNAVNSFASRVAGSSKPLPDGIAGRNDDMVDGAVSSPAAAHSGQDSPPIGRRMSSRIEDRRAESDFWLQHNFPSSSVLCSALQNGTVAAAVDLPGIRRAVTAKSRHSSAPKRREATRSVAQTSQAAPTREDRQQPNSPALTQDKRNSGFGRRSATTTSRACQTTESGVRSKASGVANNAGTSPVTPLRSLAEDGSHSTLPPLTNGEEILAPSTAPLQCSSCNTCSESIWPGVRPSRDHVPHSSKRNSVVHSDQLTNGLSHTTSRGVQTRPLYGAPNCFCEPDPSAFGIPSHGDIDFGVPTRLNASITSPSPPTFVSRNLDNGSLANNRPPWPEITARSRSFPPAPDFSFHHDRPNGRGIPVMSSGSNGQDGRCTASEAFSFSPPEEESVRDDVSSGSHQGVSDHSPILLADFSDAGTDDNEVDSNDNDEQYGAMPGLVPLVKARSFTVPASLFPDSPSADVSNLFSASSPNGNSGNSTSDPTPLSPPELDHPAVMATPDQSQPLTSKPTLSARSHPTPRSGRKEKLPKKKMSRKAEKEQRMQQKQQQQQKKKKKLSWSEEEEIILADNRADSGRIRRMASKNACARITALAATVESPLISSPLPKQLSVAAMTPDDLEPKLMDQCITSAVVSDSDSNRGNSSVGPGLDSDEACSSPCHDTVRSRPCRVVCNELGSPVKVPGVKCHLTPVIKLPRHPIPVSPASTVQHSPKPMEDELAGNTDVVFASQRPVRLALQNARAIMAVQGEPNSTIVAPSYDSPSAHVVQRVIQRSLQEVQESGSVKLDQSLSSRSSPRPVVYSKKRRHSADEDDVTDPYGSNSSSAAQSPTTSQRTFRPRPLARAEVAVRLSKPPKLAKTNGWICDELWKMETQLSSGHIRYHFRYLLHSKRDPIAINSNVLISHGRRKEPFVARVLDIAQEDGEDSEAEVQLAWYYRPYDVPDRNVVVEWNDGEVLSSDHADVNSASCLIGRCFVTSMAHYCRYRAARKHHVLGLAANHRRLAKLVPPLPHSLATPTKGLDGAVPHSTPRSQVFFCSQSFDHRLGRVRLRRDINTRISSAGR